MPERQTQIIAAATKLFLRKGVRVSTASIAKEAGVSNGTLFYAFPTKQALIDSIYRQAKTAMFASLTYADQDPFDREHLFKNWQGYLLWARSNPQDREVMHLLLDAGLASAETRAEIDAAGVRHSAWIQTALDQGIIRGPNINYIVKLIYFQIDLVITENLKGDDADLAFEMLCNSIGLSK